VIFLFTTLVVLIGSVSIAGFQIPGLSGSEWDSRIIGANPSRWWKPGDINWCALGAIATGLRVGSMGEDRPYNG
jgi:hypothetical protein